MTFTRCVLTGGGLGLGTGLVGSAFILGDSTKYNDPDSMLDFIGDIFSTGASVAAPICGTVGGAALGGAAFVGKKVYRLIPTLSPQARMVSAAVTITAFAAATAYNVGKKQ